MSKLTGRCLCGSIHYEINAAPLMSAACHCSHCRRQTGTAYSTIAAFPATAFQISGDSLKTYKDMGESGQPVLRQFCGNCGSALFTDVKAMDGVLFVKTGTLDNPDAIEIGAQIWCEQKVSAATLNEVVTNFDRNPPLA